MTFLVGQTPIAQSTTLHPTPRHDKMLVSGFLHQDVFP